MRLEQTGSVGENGLCPVGAPIDLRSRPWRSPRARGRGANLRQRGFQERQPNSEPAAMLFWALMASGQITKRRVDGWHTLDQAPVKQPLDLAA